MTTENQDSLKWKLLRFCLPASFHINCSAITFGAYWNVGLEMIHTTFQNELNKIFGNDSVFDNTRFVGRACYGSLGADLKASAQFVSLHISNQYDALKINIINRTEGAIDSVTIRFKELWGNKYTNNPNFREGVSPHLWLDGDKLEWYVYTPKILI